MQKLTSPFRCSNKKPTLDFYYIPGSAPCRAARLAAAAINVDLNLKLVDLMAKEQLKPEFLKMNPQHTVPTLNDDGFCLWESRAIMCYLVEQYSKNDQLYPKCPKKKALVNQRLYFDNGTLYKAFTDYYFPPLFFGAPKDPAKLEMCDKAFAFLDTFLEGQTYLAGKHLTIADLALIATVSTFEVMEYDFKPYENVRRWAATIKKEAPKYEEINGEGLKAFKRMVDHLTQKQQQ